MEDRRQEREDRSLEEVLDVSRQHEAVAIIADSWEVVDGSPSSCASVVDRVEIAPDSGREDEVGEISPELLAKDSERLSHIEVLDAGDLEELTPRQELEELPPPARGKEAEEDPPIDAGAWSARDDAGAPNSSHVDVTGGENVPVRVFSTIKNLDTGETFDLGDEPAPELRSDYFDPSLLQKACGVAWERWWQEKESQDQHLLTAAGSGSLEALVDALAPPTLGGARAQVNAQSAGGRAAIHIAATVGRPECIQLLLDERADVSLCTDAGLTPLHISSERGHAETAVLLLEEGAATMTRDASGALAIHLAASAGHAEVVGLLLDKGDLEQLSARNGAGLLPSEVSGSKETSDVLAQRLKDSRWRLDGVRRLLAPKTPPRTPRADASEAAGVTSAVFFNPDPEYGASQAWDTFDDSSDLGSFPVDRVWRGTPSFESARRGVSASSNLSNKSTGSTSRGSFSKVRQGAPTVEKVDKHSFDPLFLLGGGSFGKVFKVMHKKTQKIFAMKIQQKARICNQNLMRYAVTERNVLSYIRHPYIVSMSYAFQTVSNLVLVLQYCSQGDMSELLDRYRTLTEDMTRVYAAEILTALCYLHDREVVYRDLKPENVVIDEDGHSMLTDFGLSKQGVAGKMDTKTLCGTVEFMAPEILQRRGHGSAVDIYGLGALTFACLTGQPPFYHHDRKVIMSKITKAPLLLPSHLSDEAQSVIKQTMAREPSERLGAEKTSDVKGHAFFETLDFGALMRREVPVPNFEPVPPRLPKPEPQGQIEREELIRQFHTAFEGSRVPGPQVAGWSFSTPMSFKEETPVTTPEK